MFGVNIDRNQLLAAALAKGLCVDNLVQFAEKILEGRTNEEKMEFINKLIEKFYPGCGKLKPKMKTVVDVK
jgi:hypothetical protein